MGTHPRVGSADGEGPGTTSTPRRWSGAVAIVLGVLFLAGIVLGFWFGGRAGVSSLTGPENLGLLFAFGMFAVVGAVLVWRAPTNAIGWLFSAIAVPLSLFLAAENYAAYVMVTRGTPDALATLGAWANGWYWLPMLATALVVVPLLFPDGHLPSPRWRAPFIAVLTCMAGLVVLGMLQPELHGQNVDYVISNPIGIDSVGVAEESPLFNLLAFGLIGGLPLAIAAIVVRFRRSTGAVREQLKWFLAAVALLPVFAATAALLETGLIPSSLGLVVLPTVIASIPLAVGVAVLRYRLYDIDRIVSRTLAYAVVTLALGAIYGGTVLLLGAAIRGLTGEDSALVVAGSTLAAAAAFRPVRGRVQRRVERRFNRARYDAARTTEAFGRRLRDEIDLTDATERLRGTVIDLLQPGTASVILLDRSPDRAGPARGSATLP